MVSTKVGFEISPHEINRHMLVQCHGIYCPPHQSSALCSLWMSLAWWSRSWWSGSAGYTPRHVSDTDGSAARSVDDARTSVPAVLTFAVKRAISLDRLVEEAALPMTFVRLLSAVEFLNCQATWKSWELWQLCWTATLGPRIVVAQYSHSFMLQFATQQLWDLHLDRGCVPICKLYKMHIIFSFWTRGSLHIRNLIKWGFSTLKASGELVLEKPSPLRITTPHWSNLSWGHRPSQTAGRPGLLDCH